MREEQIRLGMTKLQQRQNKMKKETKKSKPIKKVDQAVDSDEKFDNFDPLAKAMEIISELGLKQNKSSEKPVPAPSGAAGSGTFALASTSSTITKFTKAQSESEYKISRTESSEDHLIPKYNDLPAVKAKSPEKSHHFEPISITPQKQKVLDYISNSIQNLDFHSSEFTARPVLSETSQNCSPAVKKEGLLL